MVCIPSRCVTLAKQRGSMSREPQSSTLSNSNWVQVLTLPFCGWCDFQPTTCPFLLLSVFICKMCHCLAYRAAGGQRGVLHELQLCLLSSTWLMVMITLGGAEMDYDKSAVNAVKRSSSLDDPWCLLYTKSLTLIFLSCSFFLFPQSVMCRFLPRGAYLLILISLHLHLQQKRTQWGPQAFFTQ